MNTARLSPLIAIIALVVAVLSGIRLESARSSVDIEQQRFGETPVTLYRNVSNTDSLVVVSHGFAGSRQMMEMISLTLARSGHTVLSFDYIGHGRHGAALSPDISSLTGTTEDLVEQTVEVVEQARRLTNLKTISLVGHSMATDVIVRATERLAGVENVVAISMYSEAVTPEHPSRLLIVSGSHEQRLREVALDAVEQLGERVEGTTVVRDGVERRAVSAPWVGHVGVLWSRVTSSEISVWLGQTGVPVPTGSWIAALLGAIVVLFWPLTMYLPQAPSPPRVPLRRAALAAILPAPLAFLAGLSGVPMLGLAGFGALALCFGTWGVAALLILRPGTKLSRMDMWAGLALLIWGLAVFALVMDHYAAAFLPTGPRLTLMAVLIPSMIAFALGDRLIMHGRHALIRVLLRIPFFSALISAMLLGQNGIGMLFTVLPVLMLFFVVYGTMAAWAARRSGPVGTGIASGIILAWSIAASTPLFS